MASKVWPTFCSLRLRAIFCCSSISLARRRSAVLRVGRSSIRAARRGVLGGVDEGAHVVELRPLDEVVQLAEVLRRLAGMAGDERRAQREVGDELAHARDHLAVLLRRAGTAHALEDVRGNVLQRDVDSRRRSAARAPSARRATSRASRDRHRGSGSSGSRSRPAGVSTRLRQAVARCRCLRRSAWCPGRRGRAPSRRPAAAPAPRARATSMLRERNLPRICGIAQNVHGFEQPSLTLR